MQTKITKHVGSITDPYWGTIIYNADGGVIQIQLKQLTGNRADSKKEVFTMNGQEAVDLIKAMAGELE